MRRHHIAPRADWRERAHKIGFSFAEIAGEPYWDETAVWELTPDEIDTLEAATNELERLCRATVAHAVQNKRNDILGIPDAVWSVIAASWHRHEASLYGRMDLHWDGRGSPKLLEYNADTPTALFEAAVVQWEWLTCAQPKADQFNAIHEALIAAWPRLGVSQQMHFTCQRDTDEDKGTVDYLRDTALQAGVNGTFLYIDEIGWSGARFVDLDNRPIEAIFKLYPWEWMLRDEFGNHIAHAPTRWIEPAWRLALSSKGILALLWELFPGHPNLLPAYRQPGRAGGREIRKPLFGREGANVAVPGTETAGPYGDEGYVHQQYLELPQTDGRYAVIGSWIINGESKGIGIREDSTPITRDTSRFVPHYFMPRP